MYVFLPGTFIDTPGEIADRYQPKTVMHIGKLGITTKVKSRIGRSNLINEAAILVDVSTQPSWVQSDTIRGCDLKERLRHCLYADVAGNTSQRRARP